MPLKKEVISKYMNPIFLETGSYVGSGIQTALNVGFDRVISIEILRDNYNKCLKRFQSNPKVELHLGDVELILEDLMKPINQRITFWLDAHFSGGGTGKGLRDDPIIQELDIIGRHSIKDHTILVDDLRDMNVDEVKKKLVEINPEYEFYLEDGHIPNDVLVAKIK